MNGRYENFDGIRTLSAIGILCMHVLILGQFPENTVGGTAYRLIAGMGVLVQLFFMLSGFGMCCGYYEKMKSGTVDLNWFFFRRYAKNMAFFYYAGVCRYPKRSGIGQWFIEKSVV